ncbi:MAG: hypothetical protein U7M05_12405, partial [Candidatus Igneacidithiobacillus chanchocoensis]
MDGFVSAVVDDASLASNASTLKTMLPDATPAPKTVKLVAVVEVALATIGVCDVPRSETSC